ncbi:metallophosphoesterase family protein [Nevskia soli]|uniref:metallophosphoesterase family protein n=1 Tax=Nevskia soli TaxID=418856 RepID=UPI0012F779A3|nr:metallophosphoesterase family protein [Nevskia soli]
MGRVCPTDYFYPEGALRAADDGDADVVYAAGGLYGNIEALLELQRMVSLERGRVRLVFGGDFHWFDVDDTDFSRIAQAVGDFEAISGNVERELGRDETSAGCGCAYPPFVAQGFVDHSNEIFMRLKQTAHRFKEHRAWLAGLPTYRSIRVAGERILLLHGDTRSLAGWAFAAESLSANDSVAACAGLAAATSCSWLAREFERVDARVIACSHTCQPIVRTIDVQGERRLLMNNGACGMPNFRGHRYGIVTRISSGAPPVSGSLHGIQIGPLRCDALVVQYNSDAWLTRFDRQWPPGSAAERNYAERLMHGPHYELHQAWEQTRA